MTNKGGDSEGISKKVLDWLTGVSAVATILTTIFGLFIPDDDKEAQLWAFGAALVLALISSGVYFYQRRRAAKLKIAEALEPLSASAALRGLLPFEEGDELPGRGRDVQDIFTLVSSSIFRFGVLWGESGCGKTSLIRAGLVPKLRKENFLPLYIHKPTHDPQEAVRAALAKERGEPIKKSNKDLKSQLKAAAQKDKKVVILFDQFEEFFLTNHTPSSRADFIKWLGSIVNDEKLPIVFLISIRGGFFAQLQNFAPQIPEPTATRSTYQLQNFDTEQAKQIFSAAAKADGIQFEPELIQAVVTELETEDFIRPAELQVVGTRLKRKNITRLSQYEVLGGARGILSSYINEEIKQSANEQTARLVLRLMCSDAVETKSPDDLDMETILRGVSGSGETSQQKGTVRQDEIQKILNQFVLARILIRTEENKYNLAHDYLAPYVRTATEGAETNVERANRMLKRYVAEYKEDSKTRIPFGRVRSIQKYASEETKAQAKAQELIKKSKGRFYATSGGILATPIILITSLYLFLANSYYFGVENSYVVLRTGHPQLRFFPGFDEVAIQTDFQEGYLDPKFREEIFKGEITGFWFEKTEGGYQTWADQISVGIYYASASTLLRLDLRSDDAEKILVSTFVNPSVNSDLRDTSAQALFQFAQIRSEIFTPDAFQSLFNILIDPQADPYLRSNTPRIVGQLAQARPEFVTSNNFQILIDILGDPQTDSNMRSSVMTALGQLGQARPEFVTPNNFQMQMDILGNPQSDWFARSNAVTTLGQLVRARPEFATPNNFQILIDILGDQEEDDSIMLSFAAESLIQLIQAKPELVTSNPLQILLDVLNDPETSIQLRYSAAEIVGPMAQAGPEFVTPNTLPILFNIVTNPKADPFLRASAAQSFGPVAQARPEYVTPEMIPALIDIPNSLPDYQYYYLNSATAQALAQLFKARPDLITSSIYRILINLLSDPKFGPDAPSFAAQALGPFAQAKPEFVTSTRFQTLANLLNTPNYSRQSCTIIVLGQWAQARPKLVTSDTVRVPIELLAPTRSGYDNNCASTSVAQAIGQIAHVGPQFVPTDLLPALLNGVKDPEEIDDLRLAKAEAFSQLAQVRPDAITPEMIQTLIMLLKSDLDSRGRIAAAYVLFGTAFSDPDKEKIILEELAELSASPKPHWRMAANRTLEMIAIGDLFEEARSNPEQIEGIRTRLNYLVDLGKSNIFEKHLEFAAQTVLKEIEKIEAQNK